MKRLIKNLLIMTGLFERVKKQLDEKANKKLGNKKQKLFKKEFDTFSSLAEKSQKRFELNWGKVQPYLDDKTPVTNFDTHYIYHPAWAARIISKTLPDYHIDISSILSFSAVVSAFIPVKFYDYRPANLQLSNFQTDSADLTNLHFDDNSIESLSCMHTVEHIGLGRYGDPLDYDGDLKAIQELKRVLMPGGNLLFVVPVGKAQLYFNAQRIYSYDQIREYFRELELVEFSLIPDNAIESGIILNASRETSDQQTYGCGCFWFRKD